MTINSFETVFYSAIFLLPGFFMNLVIDSMNPPHKYNDGRYFMKCLALSIVNCACWSWLYIIILNIEFKQLFLKWVVLFLITIGGAALVAYLLSLIKQRKWFANIFSKMGINTIHSTPTAWDYYFSKRKASFVIITLIDGTILRGWYSFDSFTSSDSEERDIYVEKGYYLNKNGRWEIDKESEGFYVSGGQIKFIEFKKGGN